MTNINLYITNLISNIHKNNVAIVIIDFIRLSVTFHTLFVFSTDNPKLLNLSIECGNVFKKNCQNFFSSIKKIPESFAIIGK